MRALNSWMDIKGGQVSREGEEVNREGRGQVSGEGEEGRSVGRGGGAGQ